MSLFLSQLCSGQKGAGSTSGGGEIKHDDPPITRMAGFDGNPCCNGMMYTTSACANVEVGVGMCARLPLFAYQKITRNDSREV